jgi:hypothetical protein
MHVLFSPLLPRPIPLSGPVTPDCNAKSLGPFRDVFFFFWSWVANPWISLYFLTLLTPWYVTCRPRVRDATRALLALGFGSSSYAVYCACVSSHGQENQVQE